jgi:transcriptional regulator with XRE-family HTH domain
MTLGEKLRTMREERGISISEVAEQTRISPLYIKAIEADDYKPLPGGIFNKGFVRSYARYIGFDENEALEDYAQLLAASSIPDEVNQTVHHSQVWTDDHSARSIAPAIIFGAVILVLLGGGIALLVRYLSGSKEPSVPVANTVLANGNSSNGSATNALETPVTTTPNGGFVVELKADSAAVWVGYTKDGERSEKTLEPGESLRLEVGESLKLGYARERAANLNVLVNGRPIKVLGGGGKGKFDLDITKSNVGEILQSGEIGGPAPSTRPAATPKPSPRATANTTVRPAAPTANANTGRRPPQ